MRIAVRFALRNVLRSVIRSLILLSIPDNDSTVYSISTGFLDNNGTSYLGIPFLDNNGLKYSSEAVAQYSSQLIALDNNSSAFTINTIFISCVGTVYSSTTTFLDNDGTGYLL